MLVNNNNKKGKLFITSFLVLKSSKFISLFKLNQGPPDLTKCILMFQKCHGQFRKHHFGLVDEK